MHICVQRVHYKCTVLWYPCCSIPCCCPILLNLYLHTHAGIAAWEMTDRIWTLTYLPYSSDKLTIADFIKVVGGY